jgi:soluble lytic murein transglycosylase-like protein
MKFERAYACIVTLLLAAAAALLPAVASADRGDLTAIVDRHAAANGIPVALARAIVRVESNWNPRVTGRAGEVGLMQIKHATARGVGYDGSRQALYDPDTNVHWGMKYLAEAWRLGGGDTCKTVLRYQAGLAATRMNGAASTYCAKVRRLMAANDETPVAAQPRNWLTLFMPRT